MGTILKTNFCALQMFYRLSRVIITWYHLEVSKSSRELYGIKFVRNECDEVDR